MKIIKQGDPEKARQVQKRTLRFECLKCGAVFECDRDEYHYGDEPRDGAYAKCPTCGNDTGRTITMRESTYGNCEYH